MTIHRRLHWLFTVLAVCLLLLAVGCMAQGASSDIAALPDFEDLPASQTPSESDAQTPPETEDGSQTQSESDTQTPQETGDGSQFGSDDPDDLDDPDGAVPFFEMLWAALRDPDNLPFLIPIAAAVLLVIVLVAIFCLRRRRKATMTQSAPEEYAPTERVAPPTAGGGAFGAARTEAPPPNAGMIQMAKLHNIGRRPSQQDSLGTANLSDGILAVVADGMGGLAGGDQVSQNVVMSILRQADSLRPGQADGVLSAMVQYANDEINQMLGPEGIYRCGSTVVAVLVRGVFFHWISVGDSRIYLYRGGSMVQLNQEHTYEVELMQKVMNGEITQAEAANDPQKRGLTSFIGMGKLKYVDVSMRGIKLQSGDRILLMTDGVFNRLPEAVMSDILRDNQNIQQAAKILEEQVLALQDPNQDNFTAILLGI